MALKLDDVKRVAHLARVAIDEAESAAVLSQLNDVFKLIAEMQAVDTRDVEPMSHALDVVQRLREDAVTESDQHALFQSVAPQVEGGLYLVPKVIE
jgi:aspartyl-tRNA(Asn)/glutamyl-tRNA(Gln) amidotransferase subunit C